MAKTKEVYVVVLYKEEELPKNTAPGVKLNTSNKESSFIETDGTLTLDGKAIGKIAGGDVAKWAPVKPSETLMLFPPQKRTKVTTSLVGTFGDKNSRIVLCTKIGAVDSEKESPKAKQGVKRNIIIEFKGPNFVNPGKVPLIEEINNKKNPKVKFFKNEEGDVVLTFNGEQAGKAAMREEFTNLDWKSIDEDAIKTFSAEDMKIIINLEITEETQIDYSDIVELGLSVGMNKEQVEKRIDVFANRYFLDKNEIEMVARSWKAVKPEGLNFIPDVDKIHYVDGPDRSLYYLLGYYAEEPNKNLRLVGIQSTGKNTLVEELASLLWKPLLQLSCSRETSREDFEGAVTIGHKVYKNNKEELESMLLNNSSFTEFQKATMKAKIIELSHETVVQTLEFMKEPLIIGAIEGWWVLLDEINLASSSVTSRFHSLLDYRREITVPKLGTIKATDGFAVITTMNPNSFVGANNMNQAFETRFRTLELAPRSHIADILKTQCPTASEDDIHALDRLYDSIFTEVINEKLPDSFLSVRNFLDALRIKGFAPLKERVIHNVSRISVNEPDSVKMVEDIIDVLF